MVVLKKLVNSSFRANHWTDGNGHDDPCSLAKKHLCGKPHRCYNSWLNLVKNRNNLVEIDETSLDIVLETLEFEINQNNKIISNVLLELII